MKKAVFLDRDGVINKVILKNGQPFSPHSLQDFEILPGLKEVLAAFRSKEYLTIVVTNQPDLSRGIISPQALNALHEHMKAHLPIDDIFICPHVDEDGCSCRKPKPGMLIDAAAKWGVDLKRSFFIGDQWRDAEAGKSAGCRTILIDTPYNKEADSDMRVADIRELLQLDDLKERGS